MPAKATIDGLALVSLNQTCTAPHKMSQSKESTYAIAVEDIFVPKALQVEMSLIGPPK
jgi:hypothetical protein